MLRGFAGFCGICFSASRAYYYCALSLSVRAHFYFLAYYLCREPRISPHNPATKDLRFRFEGRRSGCFLCTGAKPATAPVARKVESQQLDTRPMGTWTTDKKMLAKLDAP